MGSFYTAIRAVAFGTRHLAALVCAERAFLIVLLDDTHPTFVVGAIWKLAHLILTTGMVVAGVVHAQSQDAPSLFQKYGCDSCHADNEAITGPAFVDVAAKYRGNPNATAILAAVVRKGIHGRGPWQMPPIQRYPPPMSRRWFTTSSR